MGFRGACAASGNLKSGNQQELIRFLDPCIDVTKPFKKISISVKFDRFSKFFLEFINSETRQCRAGIEAQFKRSSRPVIAGPVIAVAQWNWNWTIAAAKGGFQGMTSFVKLVEFR